MNTVIDCISVGLGGSIGAVARYLVSLLPLTHDSGCPIGTMLVNVGGAFVIGLITALVSRDALDDPRMVLFLKVGVCGGFTTFSTFSHETAVLLKDGKTGVAMLYIMLSLVLSVAAVFAAQALVLSQGRSAA